MAHGQDFIESKCRQLRAGISDRVPNWLLRQGEERYSNWAYQDYRWYKNDYDHRGFRATYFNNLFDTRAKLVCELFEYCDRRGLLPNFLGENLKVVSFGCGPSCDLLGFQHFYQQKKKKRVNELQQRVRRQQASLQRRPGLRRTVNCSKSLIREIHNAKVTYTGYDSSYGWGEYVRSLGYTFQTQWINKRFVDTMAPVDVAIISYFAHSAKLQWPTLRNSSFWGSLTRKCRVILVLDTTHDSDGFDSMLSEQGFNELEEFVDEEGREVYATLWSRGN